MAERLLPIADTIAAAVEGELSPAERDAVVAGLEKVIANLDRFEATLSEATTPSPSGRP
jgi:hypothetical protein